MAEVTLILAHGPDGAVGRAGQLPWPAHREDMRRFRETTLGSTVVMGRRTYDSIGKPLAWRRNIVVTRHPGRVTGDVDTAGSVREAIAAAGAGGCHVIGGAAIWADAVPHATRIHLTEMHERHAGDVFFKIPFIHRWREVSREPWRGPDGDCDFVVYERRPE